MGIDQSSLIDRKSPGPEAITHRLLVGGPELQLAIQFASHADPKRNSAAPDLTAGFYCMAFGQAIGFDLPVVISATDITIGRGWELRTSGLWAEQVCERQFQHWSYGLEAFALAIEAPDELLRRGHGYRRPLGWELDFISTDTPSETGDHGVLQAGNVEGIVLSDEGEFEVEGSAARGFWTGPPPTHSDLASLSHSSARALDQDGPPPEPKVILPTMTGPWVIS